MSLSKNKQRLRSVLKKNHPQMSLAYIKSILEQGQVKVNNVIAPANLWIEEGDRIEINPACLKSKLTPSLAVDCQLLLKTRDYIFLNKGIRVHSVAHDFMEENSVANWLIAIDPKQSDVGDGMEAGLAHRLDFETSGVMVAARHKRAYDHLRKLFSQNRVNKEYECLVCDKPPKPGLYKCFVRNDSKNSGSVKLSKTKLSDERQLKTRILEVKQIERKVWWLKIGLITGFRHQIRAHLAWLGSPIMGDDVYSGTLGKRLMLHSHRIAFSDSLLAKRNFDVTSPSDF